MLKLNNTVINKLLVFDMSIYDALETLGSLFIIFGGVVPYIPQYLEIKRSRNSEGFSKYVCLTLLAANTLRVLFWFGHPFESPLLVQSIVMSIAMFIMIHVCVNVQQKSEMFLKPRQFSDFNWDDFWQWTDFFSYVQFMTFFTLIAGCVTAVFIGYPLYVEMLGLCSVLSEALLGMPQFYRNYKNESTEGMSVKMVLLWTCGDLYKTAYFVLRSAPMQFWLCGGLQVTLDVAILFQVLYYSGNTANRRLSQTTFSGVLAK